MRRPLVVMMIALALFGFCVVGASAQTLTVGVDAAYKPFEFIDEQGEFQGFDMDLIRAVGAAMGMEVELINTAWDGIIPGLMNGDYDVIISAMTITPERAESVNFSDPYFDAPVHPSQEEPHRHPGQDDLTQRRCGPNRHHRRLGRKRWRASRFPASTSCRRRSSSERCGRCGSWG